MHWWKEKSGSWIASLMAVVLHGGIALVLLQWHSYPVKQAEPEPSVILITLPKPPEPAPEPAPDPVAPKPISSQTVIEEPALPLSPAQLADPAIDILAKMPVNSVSVHELETHKTKKDKEEQKRAAANMLFLPEGSSTDTNIESIGSSSFYSQLACSQPENDSDECVKWRKELADHKFAQGRAKMREGAVLGPKYRLMDAQELAAHFGSEFVYEGPAYTLKDTSMDTMTSSSDSMREQMGHWPPDPVFGD